MRALLIVVDGLGVGDAPDAARFGDQGSDTLGHLFASVPELELPTLFAMGLGEIVKSRVFDPPARRCQASYGRMSPRCAGKDSASGHWEIAGVIAEELFAEFEHCPHDLIQAIEAEAKVEFLIGVESHDSGLSEALCEEHRRTAKPILGVARDSALRIVAHERVIPPGILHTICRTARRCCDRWRVRRVIAQPMVGEQGNWSESPRGHTYNMVPPRTILNAISETGLPVVGIGKVGTIFARSGLTQSFPTASDEDGLRAIEKIWRSPQNGTIFANLSDFDTRFAHARDPVGCARALERFDDWLADFLEEIESDDLLILAGDHGNDPTVAGMGHTREQVPIILHYYGRTGPLGVRETFADVAATLATFFGLSQRWPTGQPLITFHRPQPVG